MTSSGTIKVTWVDESVEKVISSLEGLSVGQKEFILKLVIREIKKGL